ncbi:MAG: hypothetical protein COT74_00325 [Bdellovibrionales bacterium CG10_big_fil_rev_8_21_14_0_10_45_34]|nr:MAG: hypothetical protein COT74_00325 [Bdellovibrionales bacterium CG10_big_fil_rev_8_21_14_0_10_45_34]
MKFSSAWARIAALNVTLKLATVTLAAIVLVQMVILLQLALRNPIVVERGCFSRVLPARAAGVTSEEISAFINEAIPMRFDTNLVPKEGYLAISETISREKEQSALKQRQISQRVLISEAKVDGQNVQVAIDRVMSVGKVKSILPLVLKVEVQTTNRSESNPYGLILSSLSAIEDKEAK